MQDKMGDDFNLTKGQSIWNFDEAQYKLIFEFKALFTISLDAFELESAYWKLKSFRREIDAKLNDAESENVKKSMGDLDEQRTLYLNNKTDKEEQAKFYGLLEDFYMELCKLLKKHGSVFREKEDDEGL